MIMYIYDMKKQKRLKCKVHQKRMILMVSLFKQILIFLSLNDFRVCILKVLVEKQLYFRHIKLLF